VNHVPGTWQVVRAEWLLRFDLRSLNLLGLDLRCILDGYVLAGVAHQVIAFKMLTTILLKAQSKPNTTRVSTVVTPNTTTV